MTINILKPLSFIVVLCCIITGCEKNYTNYYADAENSGLAIFSNTSNNLLTCFVDAKPWRSNSRINSGFNPRTRYELFIEKYGTGILRDTVRFTWYGYYEGHQSAGETIGLVISVPKSFSFADINAWHGQRMAIDSAVNGYFTTDISGINITGVKGNGSVYFNTARLDSIGPRLFSGSISGLFEADFNSFKISQARFDHYIEPNMIQFF